MSDSKSSEQLCRDLAATDTGFCNPMKIGHYHEAKADVRETLMDRGYSYDEAEAMIQQAEREYND